MQKTSLHDWPVVNTVAGTVVYPPGGRFGPRVQTDLQLVLLHTGEMSVTVDHVPFHVGPGQLILLQPGRTEAFTFAKEQDTWHRWISVHVSHVTADQQALLDQLPPIQTISEEMNRLTDMLLTLHERHDKTSALMCSLGLAALHLFISEGSTSKYKPVHPSVVQAKSFIEQHYHEHLSLESIAAQVGLSPEHLVRLFHKHEGATPIKYVWNYRILKANELLAHTGLPIGEIALRCGFKNTFHFARVFKTTIGSTPSEFRNRHWQTR